MVLKSKKSSYGYIELRQESIGYCLYINGSMKSYSSDLAFMEREYAKY